MAPRPADRPIRVLLVDDHRTVLWGLAKLIESAGPHIQVAALATSKQDAIDAMAEHRPDVVLLDLDLGGESSLDVIGQLSASAAIIVLTGCPDSTMRERAVLQGARGVVHKSEPADVILKAIVHVHAGEPWVDRGTLGRLLYAMTGKNDDTQKPRTQEEDLSPAERRVIGAVVQHKSSPSKVIAASLNISEHTLRNHLASIYSKLGIHRRLDLVLYAMENDLGSST